MTDMNVQSAIRNSLQTEKDAMDFYLLCAKQMTDPKARKFFELLAREEREHAEHFFKLYEGEDIADFQEFMEMPPDHESEWLQMFRKVRSDFSEAKAMKLALDKEKLLEKIHLKAAAQVEDPEIKGIYELNARETHNHYEQIEAEYMRVMGMMDESDAAFLRE